MLLPKSKQTPTILAADTFEPGRLFRRAPAFVILDRQSQPVFAHHWFGQGHRKLILLEAFLERIEGVKLLVAAWRHGRVHRHRVPASFSRPSRPCQTRRGLPWFAAATTLKIHAHVVAFELLTKDSSPHPESPAARGFESAQTETMAMLHDVERLIAFSRRVPPHRKYGRSAAHAWKELLCARPPPPSKATDRISSQEMLHLVNMDSLSSWAPW